MAAIGIPSTRVSDLFIRSRLMNQVKVDQLSIFRAQQQISTGRRIDTPSEDPQAAMRVMALQRLLERKGQVTRNLATNQSYLSATDTALGNVSTTLTDIRGTAISVMGTVATGDQRAAAARQTEEAIRQLMDSGNQLFRGRYLFAGSQTTTRPFETAGTGYVRYNGDENYLTSYADINLLFESNLTGQEVFGAISEPVHGTVALAPAVSFETRLGDLRNGAGIATGSFEISDGSKTSTISLDGCATIGDVAQRIAMNPPAGRKILVAVTPVGLTLRLEASDPPVDGNLIVRDSNGGTTAAELGILAPAGVGYAELVGQPLQPVVGATTRLDDVLGTRTTAVLRSADADNDLRFETDANGDAYNNVAISVVDDPAISVGQEFAVYNDGAVPRTLTIHIRAGGSTAGHVVAALTQQHQLGQIPFKVSLDPIDRRANGNGLVRVNAVATTGGGGGRMFDRAAGLRIVNGGAAHVVAFDDCRTVEDLLNKLNASPAGVLAQINEAGTGIDIRSRLSGSDFFIGENGGTTAADLGVRSMTRQTRLSQLNHGAGVSDYAGAGTAAEGRLTLAGANNDLVLTARAAGPQWNGFTLKLVAGAAAGAESVLYNEGAAEIIVNIAAGQTTANRVIEVFNQTPSVCEDFRLDLDRSAETANTGAGAVSGGQAATANGAAANDDFRISLAKGQSAAINIAGCVDIGDVVERINAAFEPAAGQPRLLTAGLATVGNGIELIDTSVGAGVLTVARLSQSSAAIDLGLVPAGQTSATAPPDHPGTLSGRDVNPYQTEGIFTALVRLKTALEANDVAGVQTAVAMLDEGALRISFARAGLGAKQQGLELLGTRLETEDTDLRAALSTDLDVDFVEAASEFSGRQIAYEASLRAAASIYQLSLLNFL